jgi:hypothetical protein
MGDSIIHTGDFVMKMQSRLFGKRALPIRTSALVFILTLGAVFIQQASAGCLDVATLKHTAYLQSPESYYHSARLIKADFKQEDGWVPGFFQAPIVGLWAFTYTASKGNVGIPEGATVDAGNTIWFADGNEITYSGIRNPIVGATCLGIWKRTGEFTYVLNHIGLSWDPLAASVSPPNAPALAGPTNPGGGPGAPGGPAFIKQYIVLSHDAQSYAGTFEITQLMTDGKTPAGPSIKGTIKAARVRIDTTTQEQTP